MRDFGTGWQGSSSAGTGDRAGGSSRAIAGSIEQGRAAGQGNGEGATERVTGAHRVNSLDGEGWDEPGGSRGGDQGPALPEGDDDTMGPVAEEDRCLALVVPGGEWDEGGGLHLIGNQDIGEGEQPGRMRGDGRRIENDGAAGIAGDAHGELGRLHPDFELDKEEVGRLDGGCGPADIAGVQREVGARDGQDGVVPIVEDYRDCDAGAGHRVNAHMAYFDAFGAEVGDNGPAELVLTDAADHGDVGAEAGRGGRLVAALAPDKGLKATGDEGLAERGQTRGPDDQVHHERPNNGDPRHGESVTAAG